MANSGFPSGSGSSGSSSRTAGGSATSAFSSGGGTKKAKTKTFSAKAANKAVQAAVSSGDVKTVRRLANATNLGDRDRKALIAVTKKFGGGNILDRAANDISSTLSGLPKGIGRLSVSAAKEVVVNPATLPVRIAKGHSPGPQDIPIAGLFYGAGKGAVTGKESPDSPFSSSIGASYRRTYERAIHPQQAAREYSAHPVGSFLEDVGNVAPVLGGASKVAKLAGLERTASALETASRAGGEVANAPFLPVSRTARLANRGLARLGERAAASSRIRSGLLEPLRLTPEARALKPILRAAEERKGAVAEGLVKPFRQMEKILPKRAEQEAMFLVGQHQVDNLVRAREVLPKADFERLITETPYLRDVAPESVHLAIDAISGANPQLKTRIDQALELGQAGRQAREAGYLRGGPEGRQAQTGFAPLEGATAGSLAEAPARLRPALAANRAVVGELTRQAKVLDSAGLPSATFDQIARDIPTTLDALEAAGVNPEHFINPGQPLQVGGAEGLNLPRQRRTSQSRFRSGRSPHEMTLRAQAKAEVKLARQIVENQTVKQVAELPFVKKASEMVNQETGTPLTLTELHDLGLTAWSPTGLFEEVHQLGPDTLVMPKGLMDSFKSYYTPKNWEKLAEVTYDPLTRAFKTIVLPLSPAWNMGNLITNAFMATFVAGENPISLVRSMAQTIAEHRRTGEWAGPERLFSSGSTHETLDYLGGANAPQGRLRRTLNAPARAGYKVNETVDNIFRSAVYLGKMRKGHGEELAMREALRAMGDFTNLSPFERRVVRRVIPFYAWLRHMSQVAVRLPIEHPFRTAWMLNMSNVFKDQEAWEEALPSFMQGFLPLGGDATLSVQNFMPFSNPLAIGQLGGNLSPQIKLALANLPGSPARGINAFTGKPYSRPAGTGRTNEFGQELPTAPSILEQLRGIPPQMRALDTLLGRKDVARYESGDEVLVRNEKTGKREPIQLPQSDLRAILKYAGVNVGSKRQLRDISASTLARRVANWKLAHPTPNTKKSSSSKSTSGFGTR